MKSMYFENEKQKLRAVIDLSVSPQNAKNPNVKNVTLDWDSDGTTNINPRFTYMNEVEFWKFIRNSELKIVKQFNH